jgi:hypothetical protein
LDGAENADQTIEQYEYFNEFTKKDSIMIVHDWHTEKMRLLKNIINKNWNQIQKLDPPYSVGLRAFKMTK